SPMGIRGLGKTPYAISAGICNQLKIFFIFNVFHASSKKPHGCANGVPCGKAFIGTAGTVIKIKGDFFICYPKKHIAPPEGAKFESVSSCTPLPVAITRKRCADDHTTHHITGEFYHAPLERWIVRAVERTHVKFPGLQCRVKQSELGAVII